MLRLNMQVPSQAKHESRVIGNNRGGCHTSNSFNPGNTSVDGTISQDDEATDFARRSQVCSPAEFN